MVGIVVVSHSHALARAAVDIAQEMLHGRDVSIAIAAGLDDATFGTDAVQVQTAIERVDGPDGVLVLMDLGSAVLSAELALELVDASTASRVRLCAAPLVEGLVAAAVAAAGGASLTEVEAEAVAALAGKQSHLQPGAVGDGAPPSDDEPAVRASFVVANPHGLHARPAARLVGEVRTLDARVQLRNLTTSSAWVPGSSLSRVATLGALEGHEVEVGATGSQAREAVDHVLALASRHFDEGAELAAPTTPAPATGGPYPASPGIGIGPSWRPGAPSEALANEAASAPAVGDPTAEWRRVRSSIATVRRETVQTRARASRDLGEVEAGIFDAHLMLLDDSELLDGVRRRIDDGAPAPAAWSETMLMLATDLEALPDEYQQARAGDVRAVHDQVLLAILGRSSGFEPQPGVLLADDLTPAQASALDRDTVTGIVLASGSATAHGAILARSRGIPAVVGAGSDVLSVPDGTTVVVDGDAGTFVADPDLDTLRAAKARAAEREECVAHALAEAAAPAITTDGVEVHVAANLGSADDAVAAAANGADLAGLVRTEFLFLGRDAAPTVDEQEATYRSVADALDGRRAVIRTLDVGGDKPLPYVEQPAEANPFLGLRGLRLALARPDLLRDQLTAICRVAAERPISVMFPMVTHVEELQAARRILAEVGPPDGLEVGVMVEVPAAALKAPAFVPHVDFMSIGTNDLTQYALAAERGNDAVAAGADPLDPAVLRLIDMVCRAAEETSDRSVRVAVCGDMAADPVAVPLLIGLGVTELSVAPYAVPHIKQTVRGLALSTCRDVATRALLLPSAAAVRNLTAEF